MRRIDLRLLALPAVVAIVVAAAWFRIKSVSAEPLWLDEGYSAYAAGKGFAFLWQVVPSYETHPPFYYSLLRLWTLAAGDSLVALRALGIVCGLLTLVPVAFAARAIGRVAGSGWMTVAAALLLVGLSPALVEMTREVRPYPVLILVYATATALLLSLRDHVAATRRLHRGRFTAYLACVALLLWLHNLGPLYAAALGLALVVLVARPGLSGREWALLIGGHVLPLLLYVPALLILLDQAPTWIASTWLRFSPTTLPERLALIWVAADRMAILGGLLLAALALVALGRTREGARIAGALLLLGMVPVLASLALSEWVAPVFIPRTMTACAVPALLLLAAGATAPRGVWRRVGIAALALVAWQMASIDWRARNGDPAQDWYHALDWLARHYRPGDQVWAYPNEGALPFEYAVRDRRLAIALRPIPVAVPALNQGPGSWNPTGSRGVVSLSRPRLRAIARAPEARAVPTIWLLRLGANAYDKGDVLLDELVASGRTAIASCETYPIDFVGLRRSELVTASATLPLPRPHCR